MTYGKNIFIALCLCLSSVCYAQTTQPDIDFYRNTFNMEVKEGLDIPLTEQDRLLDLAKKELDKKNVVIDHPQTGLIVDRGIHHQVIAVVMMYPDIKDWQFIGETKISTGKPGRREHFVTPTGVFSNTGNILGYRALGTFNENHIRGIGIKGMRVWDFGWQDTEDWRHKGSVVQIRMEMHATDPDYLAPRFGRPDSEGCIRIPGDLNKFIDRHGIIDKYVEDRALSEKASAALLHDHHPLGYSGDLVIIVDGDE